MFNEQNLLMKLTNVISSITELQLTKHHLVIAIDGMCASGKSSIGEVLGRYFPSRIIHMDDFFLPYNLRTKARYDEIGGNIDYDRFKTEVIDNLDKNICYKPYDCKTNTFSKEKSLPLCDITIIEGSYALNPKFGEYYDLSVFVEVSSNEQIERIKIRNGISQVTIFKDKWIKFENNYFEYFNIKERTNFIINTSEKENG